MSTAERPTSPADGPPARTERPLLCPSAPPGPESVVIGAVRADGTVAYLGDRIRLRSEIEASADGRAPEQRLRFASPCQTSGCGQWAEGRCTVPERFADVLAAHAVEPGTALPRCSIRVDCRWFAQVGRDACRLCPLVVTRGDHHFVPAGVKPPAPPPPNPT